MLSERWVFLCVSLWIVFGMFLLLVEFMYSLVLRLWVCLSGLLVMLMVMIWVFSVLVICMVERLMLL